MENKSGVIKINETKYVYVQENNDTRPVIIDMEFEQYKINERQKQNNEINKINSGKNNTLSNKSIDWLNNLENISIIIIICSFFLLSYIIIYDQS